MVIPSIVPCLRQSVWSALALVLVAAGPVVARQQDGAGPEREAQERAIVRSIDGRWEGVLAYRDSQSDERVELAMRCEAAASAVLPVLTRRLEFVEPSGAVVVDEGLMTLREATCTESDLVGADTQRYRVASMRFDDAYDWAVVFEGEGEDGDVPSAVRIEQEMKGGTLIRTKLVRALAEPDGAWRFRNEMRLERAAADVGALTGRWEIDLRPSADAEPYLVAMEISSIEGGEVVGTFYGGSAITGGRVSGDWGVVRFSFTTGDGTGAYQTSGVLRDGRVEGMTRSEGRGFVMAWRGERVE